MERFWISVARTATPNPIHLGIGVTARSESDAIELVERRFGSGVGVESVQRIADMAWIDQAHVMPNIGNHMARGIWFPQG